MCQPCKPGLSFCLSIFFLVSCAPLPAKPATSNTPGIIEKADHIPTTTGKKADHIPITTGEKADRIPTTTGEKADHTPSTTSEKAARIALSMVGRPYKYKGNSPAGFDCSGLVQYSYLAAGLDVPHGTKALRAITLPAGENMQIGDLLFFNERRKMYSHVGIYLGGDTFVHAPGKGGRVKTENLDDSHWKSSFVEARRLMEPPLDTDR
jgi:cell wall-associated NlpC family hydrolase